MPGIPFTLDLDVQKESPLESRIFGTTAPWVRHASSTFIYNGFTYTWYTANETDRGIYICLNKTALGQPGSWERIGSVDMSDYYTRQQVDNLLVQSTDFGPYLSASKGPISVLYERSGWDNLDDFDIIGTAPQIVNGNIRFGGVAGNTGDSWDTSGLRLKRGSSNDSLDNEVTFRVLNKSNRGLGVGRRSDSFLAKVSAMGKVDMGANSLYFTSSGEGNVGNVQASKSFPETMCVPDDICKLIYAQRGNSFSIYFVNLTKGKFYKIVRNCILHSLYDFFMPNFGMFYLADLGSAIDILTIRSVSRQVYAPRIVLMGDSKMIGYSAEVQEARFASLLGPLGAVATFAGAADTTNEVRRDVDYVATLGSKYAIVCIGRNDLAFGVPAATWQSNYRYIIAKLKANNVLPIHLVNVPDYQQDQTAIRDFVFAEPDFANDIKIDVSIGWDNSIHLSQDNLHQNIRGNFFIKDKILATNAIQKPAYAFYYERSLQPEINFCIDRSDIVPPPQYPQDAVLYQFVDSWADAQQIQPDAQSIIIIKVSNDEGHNNEQNTRYELWPDGTFGRVGFTQI